MDTAPEVAPLPNERSEDKIEMPLLAVLAVYNSRHGVLFLKARPLATPKENAWQTHTKTVTNIIQKRRAQKFISFDTGTVSLAVHLRYARRRSLVTLAARA